MKTFTVSVAEARRISHPYYRDVEKHTFLVPASKLPKGISKDPNARDFDGRDIRKRVYREVRDTLLNENGVPGIFDLMNKGIVIISSGVRKLTDDKFEIKIASGEGIVDGGHTYDIITGTAESYDIPENQFVEVRVLTGIPRDWFGDISMGLNSGIQVQKHSLDHLDGKYEWIKEILKKEKLDELVSWRESDRGLIDVRDLICILEALNIFDYPNDSGRHPIAAYEKWQTPVQRFSQDFDEARSAGKPNESKYYRLRHVLLGGLKLMDIIKAEFRDRYKKALDGSGRGGALSIVEETRNASKPYLFPFAGLKASQYRLTKGAAYPIFAAFRNAVEIDPKTGLARWTGGFDGVLNLWNDASSDVARATRNAIKDYGHKPDVLGKNRGHWASMHQTIELHMLRKKLSV